MKRLLLVACFLGTLSLILQGQATSSQVQAIPQAELIPQVGAIRGVIPQVGATAAPLQITTPWYASIKNMISAYWSTPSSPSREYLQRETAVLAHRALKDIITMPENKKSAMVDPNYGLKFLARVDQIFNEGKEVIGDYWDYFFNSFYHSFNYLLAYAPELFQQPDEQGCSLVDILHSYGLEAIVEKIRAGKQIPIFYNVSYGTATKPLESAPLRTPDGVYQSLKELLTLPENAKDASKIEVHRKKGQQIFTEFDSLLLYLMEFAPTLLKTQGKALVDLAKSNGFKAIAQEIQSKVKAAKIRSAQMRPIIIARTWYY